MAAIPPNEASWRRRWKQDFKSQPWKPFNVSDKEYLLKSMFFETDCSYELCIWDFTNLWYEKVEQESFNARAKKINPNVEAKLSYLVKFVQESIEEDIPSGKATFTMVEDGADKCILKMKTKLKAGVPFLWEFHFSLGQQDMVGSQLVKPLLAMITEMTRRQAELCTLLRKKDQEIKDYKESGARLTTKSHGTSEFDENAFQSKMVLSQGFEESVKNCGTKCFNESSCELYKQVMIKTAWLAEKDLPEPDEGDYYGSIPHGVAGVPSAQSWTDLHPPSLLSAEPMDSSPSGVSPRVSPRKTPVTSPVKSRMSSPAGSPSKDMELQRREALQKKLAEKAERNKRKRPKINL
ncbi:non-homologous end-joining factor 1-like isoform X1 [Acropora millepora]|uniref:non-homologous end-joining factor 1-like isoform X1 n=1 Tax=Acropora millepora TaxID=45264 RepID=UPI001CF17855|nr:non-homologous end-joining factor 1-like isoform X1 [Acropora millepora]